jgi:ankyrin repeat protein
MLLKQPGVSIDERSTFGMTALLFAVVAGNVDLVTKLLEQSADVHARNQRGDSAVSLARKVDNSQILKALSKFGAT